MVIESKTALLVLAAGNSSRMGSPKQLLPWKATTLLGNVINEGKAAGINDIYVVLGAFYDEIKAFLSDREVFIIKNTAWNKGMSTSIVSGINEILASQNNYDQVLIALCDQPLITADFFNELINALKKGEQTAVATCYGDSSGVPALFKKSVFKDLSKLSGKTGAKSLLSSYGDKVLCLDVPDIIADVDTPEAYKKLRMHLL